MADSDADVDTRLEHPRGDVSPEKAGPAKDDDASNVIGRRHKRQVAPSGRHAQSL
jgi:hypothetical protein